MEISSFTKEDYLETEKPYEFLFQQRKNGLKFKQAKALMAEAAKAVGVKNFLDMYKEYEKENAVTRKTYDSLTEFDGQELELATGPWVANDGGITTDGLYGEVVACPHPIMPVMRLVNIDTGVEKVKLAYKRGDKWRHTIEDRRTLASCNNIIELANKGVAVTSENAKSLVKYLYDMENINYEDIPQRSSVSRLGWIPNHGFSPYVKDLVFDGDDNFSMYFESVSTKGGMGEWLQLTRNVRENSLNGHLILAASFASVLVKPLSCLPFFVHLWGNTEAGKTVGLMLAASVWADPVLGRYMQTFNATSVGMEKSAGFVNNLPLILNELQILEDKKQFNKDIYMLCEGAGRTRGTKTGGVSRSTTWSNCILTSGEEPITTNSSGGGAVNRIIEVECKDKLFDDPRDVASTVRCNYGHAGKQFVRMLQEPGAIEEAMECFDSFRVKMSQMDTTDKQSMAMCLILTADTLATKWIFEDDKALQVEDILAFLQTKKDVSTHERAYEYICEQIAANRHKFLKVEGFNGFNEIWGELDQGKNQAFVIKNKFNRLCQEGGFDPQAFLSWLKSNGKLEICGNGKGYTRARRINGVVTHCVWLNLFDFETQLEDCPFEDRSERFVQIDV